MVPLHSPKPAMSIEDLRNARQPTDADLFDGQMAAPAQARLTYFGGPLLTSVRVYTVFWGKKWSAGPGAGIVTKLNDFYRAILRSTLIDQLAGYSVPGRSNRAWLTAGLQSHHDQCARSERHGHDDSDPTQGMDQRSHRPGDHPEYVVFIYLESRDRLNHGGIEVLQQLLWLPRRRRIDLLRGDAIPELRGLPGRLVCL